MWKWKCGSSLPITTNLLSRSTFPSFVKCRYSKYFSGCHNDFWKNCFANNYILYKDELLLLETISILYVMIQTLDILKTFNLISPESNLYINGVISLFIRMSMIWGIPLYSESEYLLMNVERSSEMWIGMQWIRIGIFGVNI